MQFFSGALFSTADFMAGHFIDVATTWVSSDWWTAGVRVLVALASVATAFGIILLMPKVFAMAAAREETEKRVLERTEQLQASQREYQELVNTVDGIVWEADVGKPAYTFVSRQAERLLGYSIERWLAENGFWQSILHPEDRARMTGPQYLSSAEKRDTQIEYRIIHADGRILWFKDYVKVICDGGPPTKMRGIMVDITERKEAETQLRWAQQEAIRASRIKSEFLANMSHEIRTPLNAIIGMAAIGLDAETTAERRECLNTIKTAADSFLILVNDILDFSKIEAGKIVLEHSDFNLPTICRNAVEVVGPAAKQKGVALEMTLEPDLPLNLRGDSGRLLQVLLNLLGNAVKFTPAQGKVELRVKNLSGSRHEVPLIRFAIHDTGIGITEDAKAKLFQVFSQADASTSRRFGGTGLGLSICKCLVGLMGGNIGMESEPGKGSIFWFQLPLTGAITPVAAADLDADSHTINSGSQKSHLRILVAEDNPANQKVISRYMQKLGCTAEIVSDGREVIAAYLNRQFDFIFMDCQMPEVDGYEATHKIRQIEAERGMQPVVIIALTAHAFSEDREKCHQVGMNDYLSKPLSLKQLVTTIEKSVSIKAESSAKYTQATLDRDHIESLEELQQEGETDIVVELFDIFQLSGSEKIEHLRKGVRDSDFGFIQKEAHALKSTCHNVGARKLAQICEEIENTARTRCDDLGLATCARAVVELEKEFVVASAQFTELLSARKQVS